MKKLSFFLGILLCFLGTYCNAQDNPLLAKTHIVPVVAKTAGAGIPPTSWQSDLVIHNVNGYAKKVGLLYLPFDSPNEPPVDDQGRTIFPVVLTLEARETKLIEDVLGSLFNISGSSKGALFISAGEEDFPENAPPPEEENLLLVTTRTYNVGDPRGTYGQTVAPNWLLHNGSAAPSFVTGVRHGGRYRSNLGIVNLSFQPIRVHYKVLAADGTVMAQGSKDLPKLSGTQMSFSQLGVSQTSQALTVELWLDPESITPDPCLADWVNQFVAYVSKVDGNPEGTGDAEFIWAVPRDFPPAGTMCP